MLETNFKIAFLLNAGLWYAWFGSARLSLSLLDVLCLDARTVELHWDSS
jgi:hypothetical protein